MPVGAGVVPGVDWIDPSGWSLPGNGDAESLFFRRGAPSGRAAPRLRRAGAVAPAVRRM